MCYKKISLVLFVVALCIVLGWGTGFAQPLGLMSQQMPSAPQYKVLSCPGGRYVFGQISDSDKDQFMLDTHTGRIWRIAESGEVGSYLRSLPYRLEDGTYSPVPGDVSNPGKDKKPKSK